MSKRPLKAICLGGSNGAWDELADARLMLGDDAIVIACNHAGRDIEGRLDHWVTMHPDLMPRWTDQRRAAGRPAAGQLWHARHHRSSIDTSRPISSWGGSSGLLCVTLALDLGCSHVILAGIPLVQTHRHYDQPGRNWTEAAQYRPAWNARKDQMAARVRSLSGWTLQLLGYPTEDWLHGDPGGD